MWTKVVGVAGLTEAFPGFIPGISAGDAVLPKAPPSDALPTPKKQPRIIGFNIS
jgi:hypothetical protein